MIKNNTSPQAAAEGGASQALVPSGAPPRAAEPQSAQTSAPRALRLGHPAYLAPEVVRAQHYTTASDYWALGCVLYEAACGRRLFDETTAEAIYASIRTEPDRSALVMQLAHVSPDCKLFIASLLAITPNERIGVGPDGMQPGAHAFFSAA